MGAVSLNYLLDRITKLIAVATLRDKDPVSLLFGFIRLSYIENNGAFLSLGSNWPFIAKYIVFLMIPILFCIYGIVYCCRKEKDKVRLLLLASIIGGGLGNLIDRMYNSFRVIDFLNFGIGRLRTGILNVADLSVTFGATALVIYEYVKERKNKRRTP